MNITINLVQSIWLHCIICISCWDPLPLHYHSNCIRRRPHYFCNKYLPYLLKYHFTQPVRKSLSKFTISIYGIIQKEMPQIHYPQEIRRNYSFRRYIQSKEQTRWKMLVWLTKMNVHHFKNDQNILWPLCLIMDLQELEIITCCWNRWHPIGNTE